MDGYRYRVEFPDAAYYTNTDIGFGFDSELITCVYLGVDVLGKTFARICEPSTERVNFFDRYAQ